MKILITGGSGMVGRNLVEFLHKSSNYKLNYPTSEELNLLDKQNVLNFLQKDKFDAIIHCAGLVGGIQANIQRPFSFLNVNLQMGLNLMEAAVNCGVPKVINLGSSCMYPKDSEDILEETDVLTGKLEPTNEGYAIAKIAVAKLGEFAKKEFNLDYKTIIPCNLYGKYDKFDPKNSHMIPAVIRKLHKAKSLNQDAEIWGDGTARREFMYAEDLADFIKFALENYDRLEPFTNVGLGYDYSIQEYYESIADVVGFKGKFHFNLEKPSGMKKKLCSIKKQNSLGWNPKYSLMEGLSLTNDFFIKNHGI